ncbi:hypothetical protein V6Z96_007039 [Aspergillus fumigatus]
MYCNDSHGISVGSLGHHIGQVDIVENILVCNTSLKLRLESKSGLEQLATPTSTGGSSGWDRNVTYEGMHNYHNDWAIKMTQFYVAPNQTACNEHPVRKKIRAENINVVSPSGTDEAIGTNMD